MALAQQLRKSTLPPFYYETRFCETQRLQCDPATKDSDLELIPSYWSWEQPRRRLHRFESSSRTIHTLMARIRGIPPVSVYSMYSQARTGDTFHLLAGSENQHNQ